MRVHVAIAVDDVEGSIDEYSELTGVEPELVIEGEYALWRTSVLNLAVRHVPGAAGAVRHLGFELEGPDSFRERIDRNGLVWETFSYVAQLDEIEAAWPGATQGLR